MVMLLSEYAEKKGILEVKRVKVHKVVPAGKDFTIHYRIDGQRYRDDKDFSKRTISAEIYNQLEVDEETGYLINPVVTRKNNFLVWEVPGEA